MNVMRETEVRLKRCREGGRWGHYCAAELKGHAVLENVQGTISFYKREALREMVEWNTGRVGWVFYCWVWVARRHCNSCSLSAVNEMCSQRPSWMSLSPLHAEQMRGFSFITVQWKMNQTKSVWLISQMSLKIEYWKCNLHCNPRECLDCKFIRSEFLWLSITIVVDVHQHRAGQFFFWYKGRNCFGLVR